MDQKKRKFARGQVTKSKRGSESTSRMDDASRVLNRDSESTSRPKNVSGEENEASRRDLGSASRLDDVSGVEYDVFLSFWGSDTRRNFTDYLYAEISLITFTAAWYTQESAFSLTVKNFNLVKKSVKF